MKKALITGIAGQDGSYLAELLLQKGYEVHGLVRGILTAESDALWRIRPMLGKVVLHTGDVSNLSVVHDLIRTILPDEVYHLATKHEVKNSPKEYEETCRTNVDSTYFLLAGIKEFCPQCRFFYASSSKIFGYPLSSPQNESTPFAPNSLYGISKVTSMYLVKLFRSDECIFACSGILYNHESPRRDFFFLPRKITSTATKIKFGIEKKLVLGNIEAQRDWGFAGDFVEAMWRMLQAEQPADYVIGTGQLHTVKNVLDIAFETLGLDWKQYVVIDPHLVNSKDTYAMVADIAAAKEKLGWSPNMSFEALIGSMVEEDLKRAENKK